MNIGQTAYADGCYPRMRPRPSPLVFWVSWAIGVIIVSVVLTVIGG
jgi:hypothetical protein